MNRSQLVTLLWAVTAFPGLSMAAPFFDSFNSPLSAGNYGMITSDPASSFPTFAFDYSAYGIPPSPTTVDGSTLGLRMDANYSSPNAAEGITLFTLASYSGDYTVKFDAWLNVNGPFPDGGSGSTNYLVAGVGSDGVTNNFVANTGSGGWTAVNGENGSGIDYRLYKDAALQGVGTNQYAAGNAANARNGLNGYYDQFGDIDVANLPVQGANNGGPLQQGGDPEGSHSFKGAFGMEWHRVRLVVDADGGTGGAASVKWYIEDLLIGTLDAGANGVFSANGRVALGYSDPTSNGSDLPTHSFALIDNLRISVPEPTSFLLSVLGILGLAGIRRR